MPITNNEDRSLEKLKRSWINRFVAKFFVNWSEAIENPDIKDMASGIYRRRR
jgi:hypothetical protein